MRYTDSTWQLQADNERKYDKYLAKGNKPDLGRRYDQSFHANSENRHLNKSMLK